MFKLQNGITSCQDQIQWRLAEIHRKPQCSLVLIQLQSDTCPWMFSLAQSCSWEGSFLLTLFSENELWWDILSRHWQIDRRRNNAEETGYNYFLKKVYFILIYLFWVHVFLEFVCLRGVVNRGQKRMLEIQVLGVTWVGCWDPNSGSLEEQQALLTTDHHSSLSSYILS